MIRTKRTLYLFEIKFRNRIGIEVVEEMEEKIRRLKLPPTQSLRTGLICQGELAPELLKQDAFDYMVPAVDRSVKMLGELNFGKSPFARLIAKLIALWTSERLSLE